MIQRSSRQQTRWAEVFWFGGMVIGLLTPGGLRAQAPETTLNALDEWRRSLAGRLDSDIATLTARARDDSTLARRNNVTLAGQEREGETALPIRPPARRAKLAPPAIDEILAAHGLPAALRGVPAVESGYDPAALSPKGARGLWQLMPETVRRYGLAVDGGSDERLELRKATHVAARYLSDLYARFHDWLLVLAAYNAGEGRVQDAIERFGTRDFWILSRQRALPEETRRYVPAVLLRSAKLSDASLTRTHGGFPSRPTPGTTSESAASRIVFALSSPAPGSAARPNRHDYSP
jgi:soluble lytic murein transglycosylase-like protein